MKHSRKVSVEYAILSFLVALTIFTGVNAQEGQITLNPTDDAYTCTNSPELNEGNAPYLKTTITEAYTRFTWLKFNFSTIPDGAIVTSATLELFAMGVIHVIEPETYNVSAHFCHSNNWSEQSIKYLNQPDYNNKATSWALIETPEQWYNWDVTNLVKKQVDGVFDGEDEATIVLQENLHHREGFNVIFSSKENEEEQHFPKLTVQWSGIELASPEFPWTSILLVTILLFVTLAVGIAIYKRTRKR